MFLQGARKSRGHTGGNERVLARSRLKRIYPCFISTLEPLNQFCLLRKIHCPSVCMNKASGRGHLCAQVTARRHWGLRLLAGYCSHHLMGGEDAVGWGF